jgi:hypothetical protein
MTYTVLGLMANDMYKLMRLPNEIGKHCASFNNLRLHRDVIVLNVAPSPNSQDFEMLTSKFAKDFDYFALLNDVAAEAFASVKAKFPILGAIDDSMLSRPPSALFTCPYWT